MTDRVVPPGRNWIPAFAAMTLRDAGGCVAPMRLRDPQPAIDDNSTHLVENK
jgi:hypothetical protein